MSAATIRALLDGAGITGRRLREVVGLLTEAPHTLVSLVRATAVERRTVEAVLDALGGDLVAAGPDRVRIAPDAVAEYRALIDYARLRGAAPDDPLAGRLDRHASLVATVERWIAALPGARRALDHVSATAETAVRRALWLDHTYDLRGARLLCVGDHDLTSLAVAEINPDVEIAVVDVDDGVLDFIDATARRPVRCLWSDLRFGLTPGVRGWADLVFTDPPYTPEGVRLFLARGLSALREPGTGRLVLSYGYGAHPSLGHRVQQAIGELRLVSEAILPGFNRYHGAQAIGSASDLYVLRAAGRIGTPKRGTSVNIYTHGTQSLEAGTAPAPDARDALIAAAGAGDRGVTMIDAPDLAAVLTGGRAGSASALAVDLAADPGGWLVRALLALDAPRVALLVPNGHPDLADAVAQHALAGVFAVKWRLRPRRSTPGPRWAIVEADRVDPATLDDAGRAVRAVLDRARGKVGNTWREALTRAGTLTTKEAGAAVDAAAAGPIGEPLMTWPRRRIETLPAAISASVRAAHH